MGALLIMILAFAGYLIMYKLYGTYVGNKVFAISDDNTAPAVEFEDGTDFVPTKKEVIFGHHFTSIAGTGPIVGPAIAIIWGWVPALLWVFIGSIMMGAVHDFGSLLISMRNKGKSISFSTKLTEGAFKNINIDFIGKRKRFYILSSVIVLLGIGSLATKGLNYGVDFVGGRTYVVRFDEKV